MSFGFCFVDVLIILVKSFRCNLISNCCSPAQRHALRFPQLDSSPEICCCGYAEIVMVIEFGMYFYLLKVISVTNMLIVIVTKILVISVISSLLNIKLPFMSPQFDTANVFYPAWNMTKGSHLLSDVSVWLKFKKQKWGNRIVRPASGGNPVVSSCRTGLRIITTSLSDGAFRSKQRAPLISSCLTEY